jgi:Ca2+-binding EF-hand superfamily protein
MTKNKFHLPFTFENSVITDSFLGNSDGLSLNAYEIFRLVSWLDGQRTLRQLLRQTSKKKSLTHEIPNIFSKTFDKTRVAKENSRRASLNRSHLEKQTKQEKMNSIFFRACNRMKKAQAGNIYNLMIKEPKLLPEADIFFSLFSLKLKTELNFHEFQKVCIHVKEQKRRTREIKSVLGSKKERMSALARKEKEKTAVIQKIFEKYDLNGDGFISFRELRLGIQNFLSKKAAEELFKEYDVDENLLLDQNEFTRLFSGRYVNYP